MLTRVRNATRMLLPQVEIPHSKLKESIAHVLKREGYVSEIAVEGTVPKKLKITLKYAGRRSVIEGIERVSSPGLRRYAGSTEAPRVRGGLGVIILSTSEGIMTANQARKKNVGGEMICKVW